MLAREIMSREVISISPEEKVDEAARILVENKISGLPVVDANNHVVGIITEKDLIIRASELKVPFYITLFDGIIFLENPIRFKNDLKKYTAVNVEDAMTEKVIVVEEDTEVSDVVKLMQNKRINRVPVVRQGQLVGIITRNDVIKSMVKGNG